MNQHLSKLRQRRAAGESGFTLIELLVVVVIIGILIAIAIPVYLNYQKGAKDKSAQSDLRNAISVLEQCNSDNSAYPAALVAAPVAPAAPTSYTLGTCTGVINVSSGTTLTYYLSTATVSPPAGSAYIIGASNSGGVPKTYCYNSAAGGSVTTTATAVTAYRVAC